MNTANSPPIITIDGPTCSGKGTISRLLAAKLGWNFLDSGILYRALAYAILQEPEQDIDLAKLSSIKKLLAKIEVKCPLAKGKNKNRNLPDCKVIFQNKNITKKIREEFYSKKASEIAPNPTIRKAVLHWQRKFAQPPGLVADGRDMGTVVFPHAEIKIFLTAKEMVRAKRRYEQLKSQGINVSLREILRDLRARDRRDTKRKVAPLMPAKGALIIDTAKYSIDETVSRIINKLAIINY